MEAREATIFDHARNEGAQAQAETRHYHHHGVISEEEITVPSSVGASRPAKLSKAAPPLSLKDHFSF